MGLLDVVLTYDCNLACDYCTCVGGAPGRTLPAPVVLDALRQGREEGFDAASFTGGEPTVHPALPRLVRAARGLGFGDVKVHTNGLLLAHGPNVARLLDAGVTRFELSVHTHLPEAYDRLVRRAGSHALMERALANLVERGVALQADLIVTTSTVPHLEAGVRWLAARGVRHVDLMLVSLTDANRHHTASLPRPSVALPHLRAALAAARAQGVAARVLYVPRCLLGDDHGHAWDPGSSRVRVVTPESTFDLSDSRLAGSVHVPACQGCVHRAACPGVRPEDLARFGDGAITAARAGAARVGERRDQQVASPPVQGGSGASGSS